MSVVSARVVRAGGRRIGGGVLFCAVGLDVGKNTVAVRSMVEQQPHLLSFILKGGEVFMVCLFAWLSIFLLQ